jgi:hypothetical protein
MVRNEVRPIEAISIGNTGLRILVDFDGVQENDVLKVRYVKPTGDDAIYQIPLAPESAAHGVLESFDWTVIPYVP